MALTNFFYNLGSEDTQMPKLPVGSGNFGMGDKIRPKWKSQMFEAIAK